MFFWGTQIKEIIKIFEISLICVPKNSVYIKNQILYRHRLKVRFQK